MDYVDEDTLTPMGAKEAEKVEVIETTDFTGKTKARYFFSKASGLLLKREWKEQGQNGFDTKEAFYSNYIPIPFNDDPTKRIQVARLQLVTGGIRHRLHFAQHGSTVVYVALLLVQDAHR